MIRFTAMSGINKEHLTDNFLAKIAKTDMGNLSMICYLYHINYLYCVENVNYDRSILLLSNERF